MINTSSSPLVVIVARRDIVLGGSSRGVREKWVRGIEIQTKHKV